MSRIICRNSVKITEARHEKLKNSISKEYGVEWERIASISRFPNLVEARRCYYSILRNVFYYKLKDIGVGVGRDHATVVAALKSHERYISVYKSERTRYNNVKKMMLEKETTAELQERIVSLRSEKTELEINMNELFLKLNRIEKELIINKK